MRHTGDRLARGSVPEVIEDGVTGFIVDNIDEGVSAVNRLQWLDRHDCRRAFENRFDAARMAEEYVAIYRRLAERALHAAGGDSHFAAPRPSTNSNGSRTRRAGTHPTLLGAVPSV